MRAEDIPTVPDCSIFSVSWAANGIGSISFESDLVSWVAAKRGLPL